MGLYSIDKCIFTGFETRNLESTRDAIEYYLFINKKRHFFCLPYYAPQWVNDDFFRENKHLFKAFILNDQWFENEEKAITLETLKELIKKNDYPKTPQQKSENLFLALFKLQEEDGETLSVDYAIFEGFGFEQHYFKSHNECEFYLEHLESDGLITLRRGKAILDIRPIEAFSITFKGLSYAIKLQEEGDKSTKCFIAMSFHNDMKPIREAIRKALLETGYEPLIIDEQNIDSDRTINDEIIASLKRCKFCIADFTLHSNGVYFESGFALGQNKKVIYTCRNDQFAKAHFDIKPLQHIVYDTTEQLTRDLINKIHAFID